MLGWFPLLLALGAVTPVLRRALSAVLLTLGASAVLLTLGPPDALAAVGLPGAVANSSEEVTASARGAPRMPDATLAASESELLLTLGRAGCGGGVPALPPCQRRSYPSRIQDYPCHSSRDVLQTFPFYCHGRWNMEA